MRLSDAILLGSKMLRPSFGSFGTNEHDGCAITMAAHALGKTLTSPEFPQERVLEWCLPWLHNQKANYPCSCHSQNIEGTPCGIIIHLFDAHVNPCACGDWTLEQLADYVRSIEPAEEAEKLPEPTADDGYYDEAPWSDSDTERERQNAIKGR